MPGELQLQDQHEHADEEQEPAHPGGVQDRHQRVDPRSAPRSARHPGRRSPRKAPSCELTTRRTTRRFSPFLGRQPISGLPSAPFSIGLDVRCTGPARCLDLRSGGRRRRRRYWRRGPGRSTASGSARAWAMASGWPFPMGDLGGTGLGDVPQLLRACKSSTRFGPDHALMDVAHLGVLRGRRRSRRRRAPPGPRCSWARGFTIGDGLHVLDVRDHLGDVVRRRPRSRRGCRSRRRSGSSCRSAPA